MTTCDMSVIWHLYAVICRACRIWTCHTRRVSQFSVRYNYCMAFGLLGGMSTKLAALAVFEC